MFQLFHLPLIKLKVVFTGVSDEQRKNFAKYLARYCYTSLQTLHTIDCRAAHFRPMIRKVKRTRSFKIFTNFEVDSGKKLLKSTCHTKITKSLSMFPKLTKLTLTRSNIPHKTLQLMSRLKSLEIWYPSFEYLVRSETEPLRFRQLRNFTLALNSKIFMPNIYTNFPIDLSRVEHFSINDEANNNIDYFINVLMYNLGDLKTLNLNGVSSVFSIELLYECMEYMRNLERFGLITVAKTTSDELQEFICYPKFFNIKTFKFNLWKHVDYEQIAQFSFSLKPECGTISYDEYDNHVVDLVHKTDFSKYFRDFEEDEMDYFFKDSCLTQFR